MSWTSQWLVKIVNESFAGESAAEKVKFIGVLDIVSRALGDSISLPDTACVAVRLRALQEGANSLCLISTS